MTLVNTFAKFVCVDSNATGVIVTSLQFLCSVPLMLWKSCSLHTPELRITKV